MTEIYLPAQCKVSEHRITSPHADYSAGARGCNPKKDCIAFPMSVGIDRFYGQILDQTTIVLEKKLERVLHAIDVEHGDFAVPDAGLGAVVSENALEECESSTAIILSLSLIHI